MASSVESNQGFETAARRTLERKVRRNFSARLRSVGDFGAGKDGTMSAEQADQKYSALAGLIQTEEGVGVNEVNDIVEAGFQMALYAYLALNTGSTNAEDGFSASSDSATYVTFGEYRIEAAKLRAELGSTTYRFMRAKADDICAVIEELYRRSRLVNAPEAYPMACEFARNMDVVAAKRGMLEYPQYTFVGAEYVSHISPKVRKVVFEAAANVLGNRTHTRNDAREGIMRANSAVLN